MSTVPTQEIAPSSESMFVPFTGMYLAFSFDLERTFGIHRCDIDEATAQALKDFSCRKFVGYVAEYFELPVPQRDYHRLYIRPLQQGLTVPVPHRCLTEDMCVPVAPETKHPLGRKPIQLNNHLPWEGCYHPTCMDVCLRIPTESRDYSDATRVVADDRYRICTFISEDSYRARLARGEIEAYEAPPHDNERDGFTSPPGDATPDNDNDEDEESSYADEESVIQIPPDYSFDRTESDEEDDYDEEENIDDENSLVRAPAALLQAMMSVDVDDDHRFTPVVRFTTDLAGIDALPNAYELHCDLQTLENIVKKCREGPPMTTPDPCNANVNSLEDSATDDETPTSSCMSRAPTPHPRRTGGIKARLTKTTSRFKEIRENLTFGGIVTSFARVFRWRSKKTTADM